MKYTTVVADPPWPYGSSQAMQIRKGLAKHRGTAKGTGSSVMRYGAMSIESLKSLPVKDKVEDNAHLYLWTTNAFMCEAHELAKAWGFKPKTIITWVKIKSDGTPSMKMGYYYRGATEHILFCTRGSLKLCGPPHPTAILSPRLGHSVKPDYFYEMVENQSPGQRLELFARRKRPRWHHWGNEFQNDVNMAN